ncbi:class I SAM-dependent methyltransferase [bacterium]|nr:class I SAM-dependent methyltransferase [bacterium]
MTRERCPVCGATQLEEILELEDYPFAGNGVVLANQAKNLPYQSLRITFCHGCGMVFQSDQMPFETYLDMRQRQPVPPPITESGLEKSETERFFNQLRRYAPEGGRVLDIGCGYSGMLSRLKAIGFDVVGIDADERVTEGCEKEGYEVIAGRFDEALFDEESFDIIVCRSVIEHVEEPLILLGAIDGLLKPGGLMAIETPNFGQAFEKIAFGGFSPQYQTYFTLSTLRYAVTQHGHDILGGYDESYVALFTRKVDADEDPYDPMPSADVEEAFERVDSFLNRKEDIAEELSSVVRDDFNGPVAVFGAGLPTVDMFFYCDIYDNVEMVTTTDTGRHGGILGGTDFEVKSMDDLLKSGLEAVILSSERRQDELLDRLKPFMQDGGRVLRFTPQISVT